MKLFIVFGVCFVVIVAAILILPLHPLLEKPHAREYYGAQLHYKQYKDSSEFRLLGIRNDYTVADDNGTNTSHAACTLIFSVKRNSKGMYSLSQESQPHTLRSSTSERVEVGALLDFEGILYAIDKSHGVVSELLNSGDDVHPRYETMIPRHIIPANETGVADTMHVEYGFVKDGVMHVVSDDAKMAAFNARLLIGWSGSWPKITASIEQQLGCPVRLAVHSHFNHSFVFFPDTTADSSKQCRKVVVTDVEYNHIADVPLFLSSTQHVVNCVLVPYHENELVLLIHDTASTHKSFLSIITTSGTPLLPLTELVEAVDVVEVA